MNILVTDRLSLEAGLVVRSSYALISIRDPGAARARGSRSSSIRPVLHLAFHDAEPSSAMLLPPHIRVMSESHARQVWRFVDKHRARVGAFVVNCHAGMSRSPAVAAAIALHLDADPDRFWREYQPNPFVYNLLMQTRPAMRQDTPAAKPVPPQ